MEESHEWVTVAAILLVALSTLTHAVASWRPVAGTEQAFSPDEAGAPQPAGPDQGADRWAQAALESERAERAR